MPKVHIVRAPVSGCIPSLIRHISCASSAFYPHSGLRADRLPELELHCVSIVSKLKSVGENASLLSASAITVTLLLISPVLQLLSDVGIQRDSVPVGREVAGVVLQGCKHTNKKRTCDE